MPSLSAKHVALIGLVSVLSAPVFAMTTSSVAPAAITVQTGMQGASDAAKVSYDRLPTNKKSPTRNEVVAFSGLITDPQRAHALLGRLLSLLGL